MLVDRPCVIDARYCKRTFVKLTGGWVCLCAQPYDVAIENENEALQAMYENLGAERLCGTLTREDGERNCKQ